VTLEDQVFAFLRDGYVIVPDVLSAEQVREANEALDAIFEREKEIGPERNWHNATYKVAYMLPQKDPLFRSLCFGETVLELMKALLGPRFVLGSLNGLSMTPGGEIQPLHIDQEESVPGEVLTINAMHTLDPFTEENGGTRVIPGSQRRRWERGLDREEIEKETVYLEAPAGSLVAFNGGLWHAGSRNRTDRPRRALHAFFHKRWIVPQWDYTRSFTADVVEQLSPEQLRLFGFGARAKWYDVERDEIGSF
jgi:ectoine hydroxylase-related dioxygenase (phytanoyl-CoA dioxygenase family)